MPGSILIVPRSSSGLASCPILDEQPSRLRCVTSPASRNPRWCSITANLWRTIRRSGEPTIVALGALTAAIGEPWLSHFDPDEIAQELRGYGFGDLEDVGMSEMAVRYLGAPAGGPDAVPGRI